MNNKITLKNGIKVRLCLQSEKNNFHLFAIDEFGKRVACCVFCLSFKIEQPLTDEQRIKYSIKYNIPFSQTPKKIHKIINKKDIYSTNGKILITENEKVFKVVESVCNLVMIEILDENFFNIGLGSTLIQKMESIIKKYNCERIEGQFSPFGRFKKATKLFYERNNFQIFEDPDDEKLKYIHKKCNQNNTTILSK